MHSPNRSHLTQFEKLVIDTSLTFSIFLLKRSQIIFTDHKSDIKTILLCNEQKRFNEGYNKNMSGVKGGGTHKLSKLGQITNIDQRAATNTPPPFDYICKFIPIYLFLFYF